MTKKKTVPPPRTAPVAVPPPPLTVPIPGAPLLPPSFPTAKGPAAGVAQTPKPAVAPPPEPAPPLEYALVEAAPGALTRVMAGCTRCGQERVLIAGERLLCRCGHPMIVKRRVISTPERR